MNRLWRVLLPELRRFPEVEQEKVLGIARREPLDFVELAGMALGFAAVTALTRYLLEDAAAPTRFGAMLANFAVALPMLVAALGPFHVRRLRRGLRRQLGRRGAT